MALSPDLISQFAKLTNNEPKKTNEATVRGTFKTIDGEDFVQIDGSDIWTPVTSTVEAETGERVTVLIKDHTATVTGNITSPTARTKTVENLKDEVDEQGNTIKQIDNTITQQNNSIIQINNSIKQQNDTINSFGNTIDSQNNKIQEFDNTIKQQGDTITSMNNTISQQGNQITSINNTVEQNSNTIKQHGDTILSQGNTIAQQGNTISQQGNTINQQGDTIASMNNTITSQGNTINQHNDIITSQDNTIRQQGNTINQQGTKIETIDSEITILNSGFKIENGVLTGLSEIVVNELETNTLNAKYANIDFSNIGEAAVEKLFSDSGIIKNLVMNDGQVTGELVGVTIKGDLIEGNTLKADKLVILGTDGLYYKLNVNALGEATASSDEKYQNGLDGSIIVAESITAEKIAVTDLVAFGATIGGFNITNSAIYSGAKGTVNNTIAGIYQDKEGQFAVGDNVNFVKFYKDQNGKFKLEISADNISFGTEKKTVESLYEAVNSNSEDLTAYIEATNKELSDLQGQIDGSIMTWFKEYVPLPFIDNKANMNEPAKTWIETDTANGNNNLKNNHLGDLFYDTITGYCYRWQVLNNEYFWNRITDVDVTKALADAAKAQDTADSKRRVFTNTPTTPYDVGDLWVQGASGDIMRCQTAKTKDQSYAAADWVKASKYTDDTAVNALGTRVSSAETKINQNSEAIELRATKTEVTNQINSINTNLSTNYYNRTETDAKIKVESDKIALQATKITETNEKIDNLEIGGRNLALETSDDWVNVNVTAWSGQLKHIANGTESYSHNVSDYGASDCEYLTFSADLNAIHKRLALRADLYSLDNTTSSGANIGNYIEIGQTGRSILTVKMNDQYPIVKTYIGSDGTDSTKTTEQYKCFKIEKGNKATDWTPAPEDVDSNIDEVKTDLATNYYNKIETDAKIKVESDRITSTVSRVETVETIANSTQTRVDDLEDNTIPIATTEESKTFYLTDSADANCKSVEIFGESTQETRSGNNLYNVYDVYDFEDIVSVDEDDWITISYDNSEGTSTKYFDFKTNINQLVEPSQNYKLIVEVKNISGTGVIHFAMNQAIGQVDTTVSIQFSDITTGTRVYDIPTKSDFTSCTNFLNSYGSFIVGTSGSITFRMSVLEDTSITAETFEYEPYGVMPSPDYPSEIVSVGYENLLPNLNTTRTINGVTFTKNDDGSITIDGTATSNIDYIITNSNNISTRDQNMEAGNYVLSGITGGSSTTYLAQIVVNDGTDTDYITLYSGEKTFKIDSISTYYLLIAVKNGVTVNTTIYPMLEKGSKTHSYIPYGKYGIEVKSIGRNLLNLINTNDVLPLTKDGITMTINTDGTFHLEGTKTGTDWANFSFKTPTTVLKANTSYYSTLTLKCYRVSDNTFYGNKSGLINPTEDVYFDGCYLAYWQDTAYKEDIIPMIVFGNEKPTTYEPYKENITTIQLDEPLRSLPNGVCDTYENGVITRRIKKLVVDGTENWYLGTSQNLTNTNLFVLTIADQSKNNVPIICDRFSKKTVWGHDVEGIYLQGNNGALMVRLNKDRLVENTVSGFKTWLSENNTEVIYELAEPIITEITDSEMITALENIRTFKNITHITADAPSILTYYRDISIVDAYETKSNAQTNYRINEELATNAQTSADAAQTTAENAQNTASTAQSTVQQLSDMISHLVTDANGASLMTQTSDGWTFNMGSISGNLDAIEEAMATMKDDQGDTNNALQKLADLVDSVANKTAYITLSTDDNGDPCIELGKTDNLFKVRITNTAIDFLEGSSKIAYANNNTFYSGKIITKQIQVGEGPGFVWQTRTNGNMGLTYISG